MLITKFFLSDLWLFEICYFLKTKSAENTQLYSFLHNFTFHVINSLFLIQPIIILFHNYCSLVFTITRTTFNLDLKSALYAFLFLPYLLQPVACLLFYEVTINKNKKTVFILQ